MSFRFVYPRDLVPAMLARLQSAQMPAAFRTLSPIPSTGQAECLLDAAYAASLEEEEGRRIEVAIAWVDRREALNGPAGLLPLRDPLPLTPDSIRRLAPAVEPKRGYLLAGPTEDGGSHIWGLFHLHFEEEARGALSALVVQVLKPGTLRIRNVVDDLYLLTHGSYVELLGSGHTRRLLDLMTKMMEPSHVGVTPLPRALTLLRLALSMLRLGHGGTILVVPTDSYARGVTSRFVIDSSRTSLLRSTITETRADIEATALVGEHAWETTLSRRRQADEKLYGVEEFIGQLTSVDGALLLRSDLELVSFGTIIEAEAADAGDGLVKIVDPLDEAQERIVPLAKIDLGTRHQSAVRFCAANPRALALVASQDGALSVCVQEPGAAEVLLLRPYGMDVGVLR